MMTKLYLIGAVSPDGENQDLFVSAENDLDAVLIWRRTWGVETEDLAEHEVRIIEVPNVSDTARPHLWHVEVSSTPWV